MKKSRRKFTSAFKTKVVLEALKERSTIQELAQKFELHPAQITLVSTPFIQRHKNRIYFSFYYNAVNCGKLVCRLCALSFPQFTAFKNSIGDLSPRLSCGCSLL